MAALDVNSNENYKQSINRRLQSFVGLRHFAYSALWIRWLWLDTDAEKIIFIIIITVEQYHNTEAKLISEIVISVQCMYTYIRILDYSLREYFKTRGRIFIFELNKYDIPKDLFERLIPAPSAGTSNVLIPLSRASQRHGSIYISEIISIFISIDVEWWKFWVLTLILLFQYHNIISFV